MEVEERKKSSVTLSKFLAVIPNADGLQAALSGEVCRAAPCPARRDPSKHSGLQKRAEAAACHVEKAERKKNCHCLRPLQKED